MQPERFSSSEELKKRIRERRDDYDSVIIRVIDTKWQAGNTIFKGAFVEIKQCSGEAILISASDAEQLINEGFFSQNRIPVQLAPTVPPPPL